MYKVNRSWDKLRTCIVGKSYPPEFYSYIPNQNVRETMERIATETEEDYQNLVALLESFGVEVLRPSVPSDSNETRTIGGTLSEPPMAPGLLGAMIKDTFYFTDMSFKHVWDKLRGSEWPVNPPTNQQEFDQLSDFIKTDLEELNIDPGVKFNEHWWDEILSKIENSKVFNTEIAHSNTIVFDDKIYFLADKDHYYDKLVLGEDYYKNKLTNHPYKFVVTDTDPNIKVEMSFIKPNLIFMINNNCMVSPKYDTLTDCDINYLTIGDVGLNDSTYVGGHASLWTLNANNIDESVVNIQNSWFQPVFNIEMLVIDENNVICNVQNDRVFQILKSHGVTPHVVNFRHTEFWSHGFNSLVCPIHREN
jgi:hypothetical protein